MAPNLDRFNRTITYLRVSVTDRCNLRCAYCQPVKELKLFKHSEILRYEEVLRVVQAASEVGISKIRLTGGEPLIRRGFTDFVASVCRVSGLEDVSITTNGVFLKEKAGKLFDAGVRRINVSLDTLKRSKYNEITGRDYFENVWEGLREAEAVGFSPIKINVVAMRGVNDDEFTKFAELSMRKPYHIRFIEYMPFGYTSQWSCEKYVSSDDIKSQLDKSCGRLKEVFRLVLDGPARRYRFEDARGEIGFISAMSQHFCSSCNRLRLTADGKLRPCLFANDELDIKEPLRSGCSLDDLKGLFKQAIAKKPKGHHAGVHGKGESIRPMSAIGG